MGSIFPTITTVKVEGSLKQLLKYSQAFNGLTFRRSLILIGCRIDNWKKVTRRSHSIKESSNQLNTGLRAYPKEIGLSIVQLLHTVCKCSVGIPLLSMDSFFCHLHHYFHIFISWYYICCK